MITLCYTQIKCILHMCCHMMPCAVHSETISLNLFLGQKKPPKYIKYWNWPPIHVENFQLLAFGRKLTWREMLSLSSDIWQSPGILILLFKSDSEAGLKIVGWDLNQRKNQPWKHCHSTQVFLFTWDQIEIKRQSKTTDWFLCILNEIRFKEKHWV